MLSSLLQHWFSARCIALVLIVGLTITSGLLVTTSAEAQQSVDAIVVEGNERIEAETVRSYISISAGDSFNAETVNRSLKTLFATGLFADVTIRREAQTLIIRVVENPIINRVAFEGNKRIDDEDMAAEVQLRPRVVYTRTRVQADAQRILELYRRSGLFAATVDPKVIQLPQNRVDLAFEINEGPTTGIRRISFVGNRRFGDSVLRDEILTVESAWYKFWTSDDTYDPDRLTFDRELLRKFYLQNGYADFRVVSAVAELTPERDAFYVTFSVEEGQRYRFGDISIESHLPDLASEALVHLLTTDVDGDRDNAKIDVKFELNEGQRVYVERINIVGNTRTLDKVLRREFRIVEGDAFNAAKIRRSRQGIQNLGFFEAVEIDTE
ncbi:MAG: POTRA domain-containing protein, partial [Alphaproteobacteria bacterium]